jgi:hypothetical protein
MTLPELGAELCSLFIFDPTLGGREGQEHEKLMFYHPKHVEPGERHNRVGLAETLVRFTATFSPGAPCGAVHRRDRRQVMVEVERDLWIVMTVRLPASYIRDKGKDKDKDALPQGTRRPFYLCIFVCWDVYMFFFFFSRPLMFFFLLFIYYPFVVL